MRWLELLAGAVGDAHVVHQHPVAGLGLGPVADGEVGDLEVGGRLALVEINFWLLSSHGPTPYPMPTGEKLSTFCG